MYIYIYIYIYNLYIYIYIHIFVCVYLYLLTYVGKHTWATVGILIGMIRIPIGIPGNLERGQAYLGSHRNTCRNNKNTYRNAW